MGFRSVLSCAQQWVAERVRSGDTAIDATIGNGVDTLFLCQAAGPSGLVYGFDVQERALAHTRSRLEAFASPERLARFELARRSHSEMLEAIPPEAVGHVAAVMFNLGYLPGEESGETADNKPPVITRPQTTLPALEAALRLLRHDGILTIVLYSGHAGGNEEAEAVRAWAVELPQESYQVLGYQFLNVKANAPYLIAVLKKNHPTIRIRGERYDDEDYEDLPAAVPT